MHAYKSLVVHSDMYLLNSFKKGVVKHAMVFASHHIIKSLWVSVCDCVDLSPVPGDKTKGVVCQQPATEWMLSQLSPSSSETTGVVQKANSRPEGKLAWFTLLCVQNHAL